MKYNLNYIVVQQHHFIPYENSLLPLKSWHTSFVIDTTVKNSSKCYIIGVIRNQAV